VEETLGGFLDGEQAFIVSEKTVYDAVDAGNAWTTLECRERIIVQRAVMLYGLPPSFTTQDLTCMDCSAALGPSKMFGYRLTINPH
jgi:hypothetical protein